MGITFQFSREPKAINLEKLNAFKKIIANPATQFFYTFENADFLTSSQKLFEKFSSKKTFVHVGIGGSSLGPEMIISALKKSDRNFIFVNNIDPEEIHDQLKTVNPKDSLFYFVSKSGGTAETMAALAIITNILLEKGVKESELKDYYVFATDPKKSELLDLSREIGVSTLVVPSDVGGRFSVLTPVGFFPALFAGINVQELIKGAKHAQEMCLSEAQNNELLRTVDFLYELKKENKITQTVMMPYSSKLRAFSFWFTQLWAESLGKKNEGLTPIVGYGATDQHSQMQLFMEGPVDKCMILIEVENFAHDFKLKTTLKANALEKLSSFTLAQLMKAELNGTIKALSENKRPLIHLKIAKNDEFHMGALILFFESLTALMGDYLMIDPFDQPGVEAGKIYAYQFLNQLK